MSTSDRLTRDTQQAARRLIRDWRFSVGAVLILALGIGANTAIFSLINASLFRPQALADPDRLVDIYQNAVNPGGVDANTYPAFLDMAAYTDVFAGITAVSVPLGVHYLDRGGLRPAVAEHTTASYLPVLGLRPALGRWFTDAEDTPGAAVAGVIGHQSWTTRFAADPTVIGRTIVIEGVPVTIVGIGPAGHRGTINIGAVTDFWLPISSTLAFGAPARMLQRRPAEAGFFVKARLRHGVSVAQAQAAMQILGTRLATEYPDEDPGRGISVFASRDVRIHPQMDGLLASIALVLLAVVGLVLAIACSNLATLLLVRGAARAREMAVRLAVGASRGQLVRLLLVESLLLSTIGGVAGCVLAWWAIRAIGTLDLPVMVDLTLDYRVLVFAVGLSCGTGVAFGLVPALKATRIDLVPSLRDEGGTGAVDRRWTTPRNVLVIFQVAVSVVLLCLTSLLLQLVSVSRTNRVGFATDGVAMLETDARYAGYSAADTSNLYEVLRQRVTALPGVQSVVLARGLPMQTHGIADPLIVDGGAPPGLPAGAAGTVWAGPGFFDLLRIPILHGRAFDQRDRPDAPRVAVISEAMARRYFDAGNPASAVGRRFMFRQDDNAWIEVIGVARDTGTADLAGDLVDPTPHLIYRSFAQSGLSPTAVLARTSLDAVALAGAMQAELRAVNTVLPVVSATTLAQYLETSLVVPKAVATFFGALGALGLSLSGIGLYAVVAFAVSRRTREIGIRIALGAQGRQVVWSVGREVVVMVGAGTIAGLGLSLLAILALRLVSVPTPGVALYRPVADPWALLAITAFMAMVGTAAACVPAGRAARIDPLAALRHD